MKARDKGMAALTRLKSDGTDRITKRVRTNEANWAWFLRGSTLDYGHGSIRKAS